MNQLTVWNKLGRTGRIAAIVICGGAVPAGFVTYTVGGNWQAVSFGWLCLGVGHFAGSLQKHRQILGVFRKHYGLQVKNWNVDEDGGLNLDA